MPPDRILALLAERRALLARVSRLEAALEPFALVGRDMEGEAALTLTAPREVWEEARAALAGEGEKS